MTRHVMKIIPEDLQCVTNCLFLSPASKLQLKRKKELDLEFLSRESKLEEVGMDISKKGRGFDGGLSPEVTRITKDFHFFPPRCGHRNFLSSLIFGIRHDWPHSLCRSIILPGLLMPEAPPLLAPHSLPDQYHGITYYSVLGLFLVISFILMTSIISYLRRHLNLYLQHKSFPCIPDSNIH